MKKILLVAAFVLGGFSVTLIAKQSPHNLVVSVITHPNGNPVAANYGCIVQYGNQTYMYRNGQTNSFGGGQFLVNLPISPQYPTGSISCDGVYFNQGIPSVIQGTGPIFISTSPVTLASVYLN